MFTITLTVCDQKEVEDILHALSEAEEEGLIDFPFQTQTRQLSPREIHDWSSTTIADLKDRRNIAEQFENEGRN